MAHDVGAGRRATFEHKPSKRADMGVHTWGYGVLTAQGILEEARQLALTVPCKRRHQEHISQTTRSKKTKGQRDTPKRRKTLCAGRGRTEPTRTVKDTQRGTCAKREADRADKDRN